MPALSMKTDDMKRVLSDQEKSTINQGVATALSSLCSNVKDNLVLQQRRHLESGDLAEGSS